MKSFAFRMAIDTPIALETLLHLDGLLCALTAQAGGRWDDIPLQTTEGIWHASAALLEGGPFGPAHGEIVRLKHIQTESVHKDIGTALPQRERRIGAMSEERDRLVPHTILGGIKAVWFVGRGHADRVADILAATRNLGNMGRTGYGRVTEMEEIEIFDHALSGLMHAPGFPARTMPFAVWQLLGDTNRTKGIVSMQRVRPPYWHGPQTECISPMQVDLTGTYQQLATIVGMR